MKTALVVVMPILMLTGCAYNKIEQGLTGLVGKPVDTVVARLGPPSSERQEGPLRVVEWKTFANTVAVKPGTITLPASIPPQPVIGDVPAPVRIPAAPSPLKFAVEFCRISLDVDSRNVVRDYHYDGNFEGCYKLAQGL